MDGAQQEALPHVPAVVSWLSSTKAWRQTSCWDRGSFPGPGQTHWELRQLTEPLLASVINKIEVTLSLPYRVTVRIT